MESKLYNLEKLITFRRDVHKHPEIAFCEIETSKKIINFLHDLGIQDSSIKRMAKTGIVANLTGKAPKSGKPKIIALRADMDALPMKEDNPHLEYRSIVDNAAHMCGHDGHVACLLGGVSKLLEHWHEIPEDKTLRLLFQPAEEAPALGGGAKPMIEEGCLDGVEEVYGLHNHPGGLLGTLNVVDGPEHAETNDIFITLIGKGGHASMPEKANDPLQIAIEFHVRLKELTAEYKQKGKMFVCTLPYLHVGETNNVIAEKCLIKGTFRSFDHGFTLEYKSRMEGILDEVCKKYQCQRELEWVTGYPVLVNSEKETEIVRRVGRKVYGENNVSGADLPAYPSEDFAYYLQKVPGCFFFGWDVG